MIIALSINILCMLSSTPNLHFRYGINFLSAFRVCQKKEMLQKIRRDVSDNTEPSKTRQLPCSMRQEYSVVDITNIYGLFSGNSKSFMETQPVGAENRKCLTATGSFPLIQRLLTISTLNYFETTSSKRWWAT